MLDTTNAIVLLTPDTAIQRAKDAYQIVKRLREDVLAKDVDYGVIPGTDKPTLYKPGAEKLCRAFGYNAVFETVSKVERWDDDSPLFHYEIRCRLVRVEDGKEVATGLGSCNSKESKYRWRWLFDNQVEELGLDRASLFKKTITSRRNGKSYTQYRIPNDDTFSLVNTIEKMACKRALIAAVLIGVGASEFFTQDVEDLRDFGGDVIEGDFEIISDQPAPAKAQPSQPPPAPAQNGVGWTEVWAEFKRQGWTMGNKDHIKAVFPDGTEALTPEAAIKMITPKPAPIYGKSGPQQASA